MSSVMKVTHASAYFGNYKVAKKSGFARWCQLVLHIGKVCTDPLTGETWVREGQASTTVDMWVDDLLVSDMEDTCKKSGVPMKGIKDAYTIKGDKLPIMYRWGFTEGGATIQEHRIDFGTKCAKVDPNGNIIKDSRGKEIIEDHTVVKYWVGDGLDTTALGKERRIKAELRNWRMPTTAAPVLEQNQDEQGEDTRDTTA